MNYSISANSRDKFVHILLSFALGGLLGDVFFHTLPHMMESDHNHEHKHDNGNHHGHSEEMMQKNLIIILGLFSFFLIEKLTHHFFENDSHSHVHNHAPNSKEAIK